MRLEKERLYYLDELKGFAILLVVLGHILYIGNPIRVWIYSFHMPLFFIISGFLSNRNFLSVKETFNKKFKSLIVPYIMFGCTIIVFDILLNKGITGEIKTYILYFITGVGRDALWFLLALFIIEISHSLLKNYIKNKYIIFVIISFLFIIGLYGNRIYSNLILITIYRSLIGLTFFMVGNYSSSYIRKVNPELFMTIQKKLWID